MRAVGAEFIGVTRKERPCFAAERGLDRLGHTSLRMVYWGHTKGTALFCCRMRPRPLWAVHFLILGSGLPGVGGEDPPAQPLISGSGNQGRILPRQILFVKCAF